MQEPIRKIAVIVAGTDEEYQSSILNGVAEAAQRLGFNALVFASFGGVLSGQGYDTGEYNIYSLVNYEKIDAAILLTNTICDVALRESICRSVIEAGIPAAIFDSNDYPEFYNVKINNAQAMRELVAHTITAHGAASFYYISGPMDNPEARERYRAFQDVLAAHSLTYSDDDVYFGLFRPIDGVRAVEEMLARNKPLPDAVIAANDAMGLEAIRALTEKGIRVPDDIIVTGFDNTSFARHHNPSLTTVGRPLEAAGSRACEILCRVLDGAECSHTVSLEAEPVYQESCGCASATATDIRRYKTETYDMIQRFRSGTAMLGCLASELAGDENPEESLRTITQYLHEIKCEQCCICLCDNWENAFRESHTENAYQISGYTTQMTAPLIWQGGKILPHRDFLSSEMFPMEPETAGNISYFFPMHFRDRCLGYYIFTNTEFPTKSMLCHLLMISISHSFENLRKLMCLNNAVRDLDRLYIIDPLCDVYNRNGLTRLADEMLNQCRMTGRKLAVSFIDMDRLKYINDTYGHDEGDIALRSLARVIRELCTGDMVCARMGGDEFLAIGTGMDAEQIRQFEAQFAEHLNLLNERARKPYRLSASIGTVLTEVSAETKLYTLISGADKVMYAQKKKHHAAGQ